jgi:hypothetical protein
MALKNFSLIPQNLSPPRGNTEAVIAVPGLLALVLVLAAYSQNNSQKEEDMKMSNKNVVKSTKKHSNGVRETKFYFLEDAKKEHGQKSASEKIMIFDVIIKTQGR